MFLSPRLGALALLAVLSLSGCAPGEAGARPSGPIGEEDGLIHVDSPLDPLAVTVPAISRLEPGLRAAVREAAEDARAAGTSLFITSGWRHERYQRSLLEEAISTYGGEEEARKWVSTPESSRHVTGNAVDIGPTDANSWLGQHGARYGLCQTYANERWHFELATTPGGTCPAQLADASEG